MPELPEVETIVRFLRPKIRGQRILGMETDTPRLFRDYKSPREIKKKIMGRKILDLDRVGKNIVFRLNDGNCFLIHLMMTGKLLLNPPQLGKHDRLTINLSGKKKLVLNDVRKFGRCRILDSPEKLAGSDPLSVTFEEFKNLLSERRGCIKNVLLNQKILAGIGNIYSDEILWQAGVHPRLSARSLTDKQLESLYQAMRYVLRLAIRKEGASARNYRKPDGSEGGYYKIRKVYQRSGARCSRDGAVIRRIVVGQRSAHFCPKHQK